MPVLTSEEFFGKAKTEIGVATVDLPPDSAKATGVIPAPVVEAFPSQVGTLEELATPLKGKRYFVLAHPDFSEMSNLNAEYMDRTGKKHQIEDWIIRTKIEAERDQLMSEGFRFVREGIEEI